MDMTRWTGAAVGPVEITVAPESLARALEIDSPHKILVPPTLPTAWWQYVDLPWLVEGQFPVLREQNVELFRPLVPGERLSCTVQLKQVRRRGLHTYATCLLEARDGQHLVATAESLLVLRP